MKWTTILAMAALLLLTASSAAQSGDMVAPNASYTLFWWTVDGGGGTSVTVGKYTLSSTAGRRQLHAGRRLLGWRRDDGKRRSLRLSAVDAEGLPITRT
jgi:hypothetical protein